MKQVNIMLPSISTAYLEAVIHFRWPLLVLGMTHHLAIAILYHPSMDDLHPEKGLTY